MSDLMIEKAIKVIGEMAAAAASPFAPASFGDDESIPCVVLPPGYTVQNLAAHIYHSYRAHPVRKEVQVTLQDPASFQQYWADQHGPHSRIFADADRVPEEGGETRYGATMYSAYSIVDRGAGAPGEM